MRTTRSEFPQLNQLIPELNPRPGRSIEDEFHRLEAEAKKNPLRHQQLAAVRYYLQHIFRVLTKGWIKEVGGVTNYQALLGRIAHYEGENREPVLIVTFNYDTLIELALTSEFRMTFEVIDEYICDSRFKLFKLHGSENWGRYLNVAPRGYSARINKNPWAFRTEMIEQAASLSITDTFMVAGTGAPFNGPPLYPAVAVPVREKALFECPPSHVGLLASLIPKVTKIITIGWRGSEGHFLRLLTQGLFGTTRGVDVVTVGSSPEEAEKTLAQLQSQSIPIRPRGCFGGFSASVSDRRFDDILNM